MSATKNISALPTVDNLTHILGIYNGVASFINAAKVLNCNAIVVNEDLNNIVTPGVYFFSSSLPNSPVEGGTNGLILMVFSHVKGYIQQLAFCLRCSGPKICSRVMNGPTAQWLPWNKIEFTPM